MFITIVNDCRDENARGRQLTRAAALFPVAPSFVGVESDLEAAGNLIDMLDAGEGRAGVILVNVAPRGGVSRVWGNGSPFAYFRYKETIVLASIEGKTFSLVKKFGLTDSLSVLDSALSVRVMRDGGHITSEEAEQVVATQFRSFDFLPRAARMLVDGKELPGKPLSVDAIDDPPPVVWWIDNFGNCKTTLLSTDLKDQSSGVVKTMIGDVPFIPRLKDVPDGTTACVVGSSGIDDRRFLEIVRQGGNAAETHALSVGAVIF